MNLANDETFSFFEFLRKTYDITTINTYKQFAKTTRKLVNMQVRKEFLLECRRKNVFPNHIIKNIKCTHDLLTTDNPYKYKVEKFSYKFKKQVLNTEIDLTFWSINTLSKHIKLYKDTIIEKSSPILYTIFFDKQERFVTRLNRSMMISINNKLRVLIHDQCPKENLNQSVVPAHIVNLTNVQIPDNIYLLLSYGAKFAIGTNKPTKKQIFATISDAENILKDVEDINVKNSFRGKVVNILLNNIHTPVSVENARTRFINKSFYESKRFFQHNTDIITLQSDKGNKTVIMYREEYTNKIQHLLNDGDTYAEAPTDPTNKVMRKNNLLTKLLFDKEYIDIKVRKKLTTYNAISPRLYGLPKIHKPNIPLRPIVSCINSPTYSLSKFLSEIIYNTIDQSKYNIRNSYEFKEFIIGQTLPQNYILISLDVVSLFTNIPLDLVMDNIDQWWHRLTKRTSIPLVQFRELMNFALTSNYFSYDDKFYYQRSGTPMGSCLSPAVADMVMDILLDNVREKLNFDVPFIKKYVDDLFTVIPVNKSDEILRIFNSYHPKLQFTIETEIDGKLPFLDMVIVRNCDGSMCTEWYMKSIASGRILNYYSGHYNSQKINTALGLIQRIVGLTTHVQPDTYEIAKKLLLNNNYPTSIINRLINKVMNSYQHHQTQSSTTSTINPSDNNANKHTCFKSLTFTGDTTYKISRVVREMFPHILLGYKCPQTLASVFSKLKDQINYWKQSNLIYEIPCQDCNLKYVGLTTRQLKTRIDEHSRDYQHWLKVKDNIITTNNLNTKNKLSSKTAALKHVIDDDHIFNYAGAKILTMDSSHNKLRTLEMLHIYNTECVNSRTDTEGINLYKGLLSNIRFTIK